MQYLTPFESGNGNQTTDLPQCVAFYQRLAADFPSVLKFWQIGVSDGGTPIHAGLVTSDGVLEREQLRAQGRPVFFNNNGIHTGEPEGIDACMALVRDFCTQPERRAALERTAFLFIAVYNVDGCLNRRNTWRVDQVGPEYCGSRDNGRQLDLNRDFVKCDSLSAQIFNRFFTDWDPDVMVDTHTSNGADYTYTMTLIPTQTDKLGGGLGEFMRNTMLDAIDADMDRRGWPTCPFMLRLRDLPEQGIRHLLDVPRFSTGYAALHHTIGFMPETHMLKSYADRYVSMLALIESVLAFTVEHAPEIQKLRRQSREEDARRRHWPVHWEIDFERPRMIPFKGYKAVYTASTLGNYTRMRYDRTQPWTGELAYFDRCVADVEVQTPRAYLIPAAWREVLDRLRWNRVNVVPLEQDQTLEVRAWYVTALKTRATSFEGHMFHDEVSMTPRVESYKARAGDCLVPLDQERARYVIETLEPQGHDSFFRWGFFNSILDKREIYSDYVFEDLAIEALNEEPNLRARFEQWKRQNPELLSQQRAVLDFIFQNAERFREPGWRRYPVLSVM